MVTTPGLAYSMNGRKATNFSLLEDFRKSTGENNGWATRQRTFFSSSLGAQERLNSLEVGTNVCESTVHHFRRRKLFKAGIIVKDKESKWWAQGVDKLKR